MYIKRVERKPPPYLIIMAILTIATMNCHGQTKFNTSKQLFIQNFLKIYNIDILLCQETKIEEGNFNHCEYLGNNYTIIKNNSHNKYQTSVIIKNKQQAKDIKFDTEGRIIVFNTDDYTIVNVYPKAGTDVKSRREREEIFVNTLPKMLQYTIKNLIIVEDWNCIMEDIDCTNFPKSTQPSRHP